MSARLAVGAGALAMGLLLHVPQAPAADFYQYDAAGRLVRVVHTAGPTITYSYDSNGNLLSMNSTPVAVEPPPASRFDFALGKSFPDPAAEVSRIRFSISRRERVRLEVYDIRGRRVATLVDGVRDPGEHLAELRTRSRAAGVYMYRLRSGGQERSRRFVVVH